MVFPGYDQPSPERPIRCGRYELIERIGTLSAKRVRQILDGIRLFLEPRDLPEP